MNRKQTNKFLLLASFGLLLWACGGSDAERSFFLPTSAAEGMAPQVAPYPTRPAYKAGELVDYTAQNGDTLPALAAHFNTTISEIRRENPIIPDEVTTLPAGLPMQIPIYFRPFWGSPYQIVPDSVFVNGPSSVDFDTVSFVAAKRGWLKDYSEFAAGATRSGAQIIDYVATNFSISPRVLLALLEYQANGLSDPTMNSEFATYPLGYERITHRGLYLQLVWAANRLNNGYYGWRTGRMVEFEHPDGRVENPGPWQNAASVALHYYFNEVLPQNEYLFAIGEEGLAQTYQELFGDPWKNNEAHIPGSLEQPEFSLPFAAGQSWAFTGGPHTGWGTGEPLAALDFAPPSVVGGCQSSREVVTAVAPGLVVRTGAGIVVLDLDQDGDERTGWVIFYLHVGTFGKASVGDTLNKGDQIGHPSCEGGDSTGSHVHLARKYNGEWIPAAGALPFVMEGWTPQNGDAPYRGTLTRLGRTVSACECSTQESHIRSSGVTGEQNNSGVN